MPIDANSLSTIVLTGPESSGKTTLAQLLAAAYDTAWVPEQARGYLTALGRDYTEADLRAIAKRQLRVREVRARRAKGYLFCDTDMLVLKIWSLVKYGRVDPFITKALRAQAPAAYLLCKPDIPWEPDPLRESAGKRDYLFDLYRSELENMSVPYLVVEGTVKERIAQVRQFLSGNQL